MDKIAQDVDRFVDYRKDDEMPALVCPECGAPVLISTRTGNVSPITTADFRWLEKHGLSGPGHVQTVYWQWMCSADSLHYWGPVLLAGSDG